MKQGFPIAAPGMRIGILGGSFDPAHEGHAHITHQAIRHFGLDRVWWMLSPGNPLKARGPAPMALRIAQARRIIPDPRVDITDLETRLGTRYTAETLSRLLPLYRGVQFVWLMGADNLVQFDRWDNWQEIMQMVPVGVLARPGSRLAGKCARAARIFDAHRLPAEQSHRLPLAQPPAWCFVDMPMSDLSSSAIRARGDWRGTA
ncbi:nicotinate-nucleotide adenylyltransferase [Sedimentimonas flavescens]|uniref:Probable nicotinate-nucleotide adenylyltransferase n=1 Tax=Sedimentimonas flavescens TaxID=2851012 RepID=A0ABT2ZX46_9RHOB|nr:nicotinate-nucleotide adenylyltransferase [Sedimentimonas flavescens]MCV2878079.1 nicotinate-nucleotide adenylyltransferase [Sedimentimonas flavescens]